MWGCPRDTPQAGLFGFPVVWPRSKIKVLLAARPRCADEAGKSAASLGAALEGPLQIGPFEKVQGRAPIEHIFLFAIVCQNLLQLV